MFPFVEKRKISYLVVAAILLFGLISYFIHGGFNLDIQFQGGTEIKYSVTTKDFNSEKAQSLISEKIKKTVTVLSSENSAKENFLVIRVSSSLKLTNEEVIAIDKLLKDNKYPVQGTASQINISANIGAEYMRNGIFAIFGALALIIVYIAIRFKAISGWSAGIIATIAILSDALLMISVYLIFNIALNESFIAGVLTVIGYSINDKIIIYDRIRENSSGRKKGSNIEIVNLSIYQTLTRSINTALTAIMSLAVVFVLATMFQISSVAQFAFPMIIGVAFGCLSSIFIAGPALGAYKESNAKLASTNQRSMGNSQARRKR
ncbi:MAG: protein translocase subunit SecF [Bacillota bacterium]